MYYDIEKEKREAREAGERALRSLRNAQNELNGAKNWGMVDMLGGGFLTSMIKRGKMRTSSLHVLMTVIGNMKDEQRTLCRP